MPFACASLSKIGVANSCYIDVTGFGAKIDGVSDDLPAVLAAVASAGNEKKTIYIPPGKGPCLLSGPVDLKRSSVTGCGQSRWEVVGGSKVLFQEGGFYSSIDSNKAYTVSSIYIRGTNKSGQILVDYTGQNYPRMWDVTLDQGDVNLLLRESQTSSTECHYGEFYSIDNQRANRLVSLPNSTKSGGHTFFGGRWWRANEGGLGAYVGAGVNNVVFSSLEFETGSETWDIDANIRSAGNYIDIMNCRSELVSLSTGLNTPRFLWVLQGAGEHNIQGGAPSSGRHVRDENRLNGGKGVIIANVNLKHDFGPITPNARHGELPDLAEIHMWDQGTNALKTGTLVNGVFQFV